MKDMNDLDGIQAKGVKALFALNLLLGVSALITALVYGKSIVGFAIPAAVFVAVGAWALFGGYALHHRVTATVAGAGQVTLIVAAFAGHPWQLDSHMVFFAYIPVTAAMLCPTSIAVSALVAVAHHLGLSFVMPLLVFPSTGLAENVMRSVFHGVVIAGRDLCAVLWREPQRAQDAGFECGARASCGRYGQVGQREGVD